MDDVSLWHSSGSLGLMKKVLSRRWRNAIITDPPLNLRRASILAWLASKRLAAGEIDDSAAIAPIYLRTVKNIDH